MHDTVAQSPDTQSSELLSDSHGRGASAGIAGRPYLVIDVANSTFSKRGKCPSLPWTVTEKTRYHRLQSILYYWEKHHFSIIRVDLTTAPGGEQKKLGPHFEEFIRRIERKEKRKVQYWRLTTREGNGVIHSLLAAPSEKSLFLPHKWISNQWRRIHGAPRVYVKRYSYGEESRKKVSRYLVSQYMAGQNAGVRISASWKETFGFPVEHTWALFREGARAEGRRDALSRWQGLLRGETVAPREGVAINLAWLRGSRLRIKLKPGWGPDYPTWRTP